MSQARILRLTAEEKARLNVLFLAKHARSGGKADAVDGSHAVYHHEMLETLRTIGLSVEVADSFEELPPRKGIDFVVPLLNRAGFLNSEMLAPLLLERAGVPYLGAKPIIRGIADDKSVMKRLARAHGVTTCDWAIFRRGWPIEKPAFADGRKMIVKPNASSASWGIVATEDWATVVDQVIWLQEQGHDAIVEPWLPAMDIAVPVVGADGPWFLPPLMYPNEMRSYEEKRNLIDVAEDPLIPLEDADIRDQLYAQTRAMMAELWPFDYGRFEFRYDPATRAVSFMEVNISCNLWSKKSISRSAGLLGVDHASLVETILTHSLRRQGVVARPVRRLAA